MELPQAFVEKMTELLGSEAEQFLKSYQSPRSLGLRYNPLKINQESFLELVPFHLTPIPFCETGFYYELEDEPGKHPYHQAGLYYIQEPSAMAPAELLEVKPGERVLDLCAAPGGKSTQLAGALQGQGILISNEYVGKRAKILSENIERMGVTNAIVLNESPDRLASVFSEWFDKILVDAPCSGEGMFRKDPEACTYWSPDHVMECSNLQTDILEEAYSMLKKGGTLVYSTCTFSPEENEQMIAQFLTKHPDLKLHPIDHTKGISPGRPEWAADENRSLNLSQTGRLWPHKLNGEGHFAAKIFKSGEAERVDLKSEQGSLPKTAQKDFLNFVNEALNIESPKYYKLMGTNLYSIPKETPDFSRIKVLRMGLHLGELKKNRFEPSHAWALALKSNEVKRSHELTSKSDAWRRYLRGETLPTDSPDGWTLVLVDGYSIGWGKAVQGTLKNYYPKGLRRP